MTGRKLKDQLREVVDALRIHFTEENLFSRCLICNNKITKILDKKEIEDKVPSTVYKIQNEFYCCKTCNKVFWGSEKGNERSMYLNAVKFCKEYSFKETK